MTESLLAAADDSDKEIASQPTTVETPLADPQLDKTIV
jgi:hypothetical protein